MVAPVGGTSVVSSKICGGAGSQGPAALVTVTVTPAAVAVLPSTSRARADSVCEPFVASPVLQDAEYGALVASAPSGAPSRRSWTLATQTLSEALADTVTVPDTVD